MDEPTFVWTEGCPDSIRIRAEEALAWLRGAWETVNCTPLDSPDRPLADAALKAAQREAFDAHCQLREFVVPREAA